MQRLHLARALGNPWPAASKTGLLSPGAASRPRVGLAASQEVTVNVPQVAESISEGDVGRWFKGVCGWKACAFWPPVGWLIPLLSPEVGDAVAVDEAVVELETDKVAAGFRCGQRWGKGNLQETEENGGRGRPSCYPSCCPPSPPMCASGVCAPAGLGACKLAVRRDPFRPARQGGRHCVSGQPSVQD